VRPTKIGLAHLPLAVSRVARAGVEQDALYLVRPDGYVGLADPEASPARLERYLDTR
jgi:hypothetical protein